MSHELTHYGVKGMKWGVRKEQTRTYKDLATSSKKLGLLDRGAAKINMYRYYRKGSKLKARKKFDTDWYNKLSTRKEYLPVGKKLNRVVREVNSNALNGPLYVARNKSDAALYKA